LTAIVLSGTELIPVSSAPSNDPAGREAYGELVKILVSGGCGSWSAFEFWKLLRAWES